MTDITTKIKNLLDEHARVQIQEIIHSDDFEVYSPMESMKDVLEVGAYIKLDQVEGSDQEKYAPLANVLKHSIDNHAEDDELDVFVNRWEKLKAEIDQYLKQKA